MVNNSISFKGFNENVLTFKSNSKIPIGAPVSVDKNGFVFPTIADSDFIGVCLCQRGGNVSVQVSGYVEVPYLTKPANAGWHKLCAGSNNTVQYMSDNISAPYFRVLKIDEDTNKIGFIL